MLRKLIQPAAAKSVLKIYISALSVYGLVLLNWRLHVFYFSLTVLNYIFFLLILAVPLPLILASLRFPKVWMKIAGIVCQLPMLAISLFLGFFTAISLPDVIQTGQPALTWREYTVHSTHYDLTVYRGDGSYSVWQEKRIVPGLLLARRVYTSGAWDPEVKILDDDRIKVISFPPNKEQQELTLKRFVYF